MSATPVTVLRSHLSGAIDGLLGRVTMYRLMTLVLTCLAVWSVLLSALGQLYYSPVDLLVTAAVAVAASYLSNRAFALAWRVRPHSESAVITGLLLFFLFWPSTQWLDLAVVAGAAAVANLSKYLIVVRGRHVLNPAAFGAFVVGLTGISGSVWWVAAPLMLPAVIVGALVVLRRTGRTLVAACFVVVAMVPVTITLVSNGASIGSALATAIGSYPLVFLAVFMLTEPLTLPPRRWQQLLEATAVAALFAVAFHLSLGPVTVTNSPELALLAGNLLALCFAGRGVGSLTLIGTRKLTPTVREFTLRPAHPVTYTPGQFVELTVPHAHADSRGTRRTFSLSGPPGTDLTIAVKVPAKPSSFKRALLALEPGATLRGSSRGGDFVLPSDHDTALLLVAGGIGITPFASQLAALTAAGEHRDIVVLYAVSAPQELAYADIIAAAGVRTVVISPTAPTRLPERWTHLPGDKVTSAAVAQAVPDAASRVAMVSGPPAMVDAVRAALTAAGLRSVTTDVFFGY